MYGPVATWFWPYCDGFCLSNFAAYSLGTGADRGNDSAPITVAAVGLVSLMTSVWSSGVWKPEIGLPSAFFLAASTPSTVAKYEGAYPLATVELNPRSSANLTSFDVAARFTGGLNLTPWRTLIVIVLPSLEICGSEAAKSGTALVVSSGL